MASLGTAVLSIGTILGCLLAPVLAERIRAQENPGADISAAWRPPSLLAFGWAFYLRDGLACRSSSLLFFLGLAGGNFAIFSLWLPEQYNTEMRATAFAFCTSFGRFLGAGANFAIAALIQSTGSLGIVIALTAIPFVIGLAVIPFALETKGEACLEPKRYRSLKFSRISALLHLAHGVARQGCSRNNHPLGLLEARQPVAQRVQDIASRVRRRAFSRHDEGRDAFAEIAHAAGRPPPIPPRPAVRRSGFRFPWDRH